MTLIPLSSKCVGLSTPRTFINRGPGGISHPRVNKGHESVDHQLKGLNKHRKHRSQVCAQSSNCFGDTGILPAGDQIRDALERDPR